MSTDQLGAVGGDAKGEIDALVAAFFALFSNRSGAPDLERIFLLFVPQGVIARCVDERPQISDLAGFIAPRRDLLTNGTLTGFEEREVGERTDITGHIAQRLSTYTKSGVLNGVPFSAQGAKTFQFVEVDGQWRILSVAWDDERKGFLVPSIGGRDE